MHQICIEAEQKFLKLMIDQHEANLIEDSQAINMFRVIYLILVVATKLWNQQIVIALVNMANIQAKFNELKAIIESCNIVQNDKTRSEL